MDLKLLHFIQLTYLGMQYTFNIKNELLPPNPENGRERSTISYEHAFCAPNAVKSIGRFFAWDPDSYSAAARPTKIRLFIPWSAFKATYRGKDPKGVVPVPALNPKDIKRFGIMSRSFFGEQKGAFSLGIRAISTVRLNKADGLETRDVRCVHYVSNPTPAPSR
jgi:hypothetical protein